MPSPGTTCDNVATSDLYTFSGVSFHVCITGEPGDSFGRNTDRVTAVCSDGIFNKRCGIFGHRLANEIDTISGIVTDSTICNYRGYSICIYTTSRILNMQ